MNLRDFFKQPVNTSATVQGVEMDVTVQVDYHAPRRDPVCCKCLNACDLITIENIASDNGVTAFYREEGRSFCCKAGYTLGPDSPVHEQAEALDVWNARGVSVMDGMYVIELCELEDRLLAMAKADLESRKADATAFARQVREEALAVGQAQRGVRV